MNDIQRVLRLYSNERHARSKLERYVERLEDRLKMVKRERDEAKESLRGNSDLRMVAVRYGIPQHKVREALDEFIKTKFFLDN
jgi:transcription initiation factor IIE alpha subunit